jgi:hypothetical protein
MAQQDVHRDEVLTFGRERPLLDSHPERREAQLRIPHEREQLGDARQLRGECDDLGEAAPVVGEGHEGRAIPQAGFGHRAGL